MTSLARVPGVRFTPPAGGFSIWVQTDLEGSDASWLYAALENGVAFDPGGLFYANVNPDGPLSMRLSFSSVPTEQIEAGVARLDKVLRSTRAHRLAA